MAERQRLASHRELALDLVFDASVFIPYFVSGAYEQMVKGALSRGRAYLPAPVTSGHGGTLVTENREHFERWQQLLRAAGKRLKLQIVKR